MKPIPPGVLNENFEQHLKERRGETVQIQDSGIEILSGLEKEVVFQCEPTREAKTRNLGHAALSPPGPIRR